MDVHTEGVAQSRTVYRLYGAHLDGIRKRPNDRTHGSWPVRCRILITSHISGGYDENIEEVRLLGQPEGKDDD